MDGDMGGFQHCGYQRGEWLRCDQTLGCDSHSCLLFRCDVQVHQSRRCHAKSAGLVHGWHLSFHYGQILYAHLLRVDGYHCQHCVQIRRYDRVYRGHMEHYGV